MVKRLILPVIFLVFSFKTAHAQTMDSAVTFYKRGVLAFKSQEYKLADSLYGISLNLRATANTYFNRAVVRSELRDRCGYCENLGFAAGLGDKEASNLFLKHCGKTDTLYAERITRQVPSVYTPAYQVYYRSQYMNDALIVRYRMNNSFHSFSWAKADTRLETEKALSDSLQKKVVLKDSTYQDAQYPGGIPATLLFIQQNTQYPAEAREAGISGKVYLQFIINTLGYIQEIEVMKGIPKCKTCDDEAIRIISMMPRWRPSKMNGKPVLTYFKLPFSFKIG